MEALSERQGQVWGKEDFMGYQKQRADVRAARGYR